MFVPDGYHQPDDSWPVEIVRANPLAQLTSNGSGTDGPHATHVPIIPDPHTPAEHPALPGITLWGHMNRANPHWTALTSGCPVLAVFTGPHAYVSPTVYETSPAAPTWDFTAVHVRGELRKVESSEETLATVTATVRAFEERFGAGWDMSGSVDYFRRILPGVGAFRLTVTSVESMFKLSQEQPEPVRDRVRNSFAGRGTTNHHEIAALMDRLRAFS